MVFSIEKTLECGPHAQKKNQDQNKQNLGEEQRNPMSAQLH